MCNHNINMELSFMVPEGEVFLKNCNAKKFYAEYSKKMFVAAGEKSVVFELRSYAVLKLLSISSRREHPHQLVTIVLTRIN